MTGTEEIFVLWLVPRAWEEEGRLVPQHAPIALEDWVQTIREEGMTVRPLPEGRITGGPCDGGQVVAVEGDLTHHLFALPPAALPALADLVLAAEERPLLQPDDSVAMPSGDTEQAWDTRADGDGWTTALVYPLDPAVWETRQAVVPGAAPLSVRAWLHQFRETERRAVSLSPVLDAPEQPWDAGRVVGLEGPDGRTYMALPPAARVILANLFAVASTSGGSHDVAAGEVSDVGV
jgi:hypothetical protein